MTLRRWVWATEEYGLQRTIIKRYVVGGCAKKPIFRGGHVRHKLYIGLRHDQIKEDNVIKGLF